ncbi:uncharacterized protein [Montipora foliosa]|uniref:uncharacterized protein n=1 Tax=Montipora foliosa TaxID=591990 RepID=UPI0035F10C98
MCFGNGNRAKKNESLVLEFAQVKTRDPPHRQPCLQATKDHRYLRINGALSAMDLIQLSKCAVVTDPESRKKSLRQMEKCFGCLRSGHVSRDCQTRCHRCSGKHHVALCSVQHYPEYPIMTRRARDGNREQTNHVEREELHGPAAIHTGLGYVLSGPVNATSANTQLSTVNVSHVMNMKTECQVIEENLVSDDFLLKEELSRFWDYDTLGVKDIDGDFLEDYVTKVKFNGTRYEVSLPFKTEYPIIPDNYLLAQNRLVSSLQRLRSKPELLQQYDSVSKEQLNAGVVELIAKSHDLDTLPGTVHYIPHKEVLKEDKTTTKLRVVYDAIAKSRNEPSLNDCLLSGPALTPLIFDVLLRFLRHKVALIGDLEKAFFNIEVNPAERNLLRFLWVDDINSPNPEVITLRFTRLVFGLVCSPFILNVTLRNHLARYENINSEFVAAVVRALNVDDFASGESSVMKCFELYHKLNLWFREGGCNMRKWASNSEELTEMIKRAEESLSWEPELSCKATPTLTELNIEE